MSWRLRDIGQCIIIELCMDQHPVLRMPFLSPSLSGSFIGGSWGNGPALTRTKYLFPDICPRNWDHVVFCFFFSLSFFFNFIFKLYNIVLVLPNIEMNPPQVYPCSPSWTLHPPPSPPLPLGHPSAPAPSIQYHASNLDWWLVSYMILYMFQCYSPKTPHPLPLP